jgi:hypothetical protein
VEVVGGGALAVGAVCGVGSLENGLEDGGVLVEEVVVVLAFGIWPADVVVPPTSVVAPVALGTVFESVEEGAVLNKDGDGSVGLAALWPLSVAAPVPSLTDSLPVLLAKPNKDLPSFEGAFVGVKEELNGFACGFSAVFGLAKAANGFGLLGCSSIWGVSLTSCSERLVGESGAAGALPVSEGSGIKPARRISLAWFGVFSGSCPRGGEMLISSSIV